MRWRFALEDTAAVVVVLGGLAFWLGVVVGQDYPSPVKGGAISAALLAAYLFARVPARR